MSQSSSAPKSDQKLAVQHTLAIMKAKQKEKELKDAAAEVISSNGEQK